jgi:hypothetical protein
MRAASVLFATITRSSIPPSDKTGPLTNVYGGFARYGVVPATTQSTGRQVRERHRIQPDIDISTAAERDPVNRTKIGHSNNGDGEQERNNAQERAR